MAALYFAHAYTIPTATQATAENVTETRVISQKCFSLDLLRKCRLITNIAILK